jgi:hypothetical protein
MDCRFTTSSGGSFYSSSLDRPGKKASPQQTVIHETMFFQCDVRVY